MHLKNGDFEVHNLTIFEEIRLSRQLSNAVDQAIRNGHEMSPEVIEAFKEIFVLYQWQMDHGIQ